MDDLNQNQLLKENVFIQQASAKDGSTFPKLEADPAAYFLISA